MEYNPDRTEIKDINIAYIGGGSRGWAWNLMGDLALEGSLGGQVSLYDIDRKAAEDNETIGNRLFSRPEVQGDWTFKAVGDLATALKGADFVIISILPGTFEEMYSDVHTPEQYGIYQSVGDTTGPGGIIRALRTIPMYVEIAEAIKEFAPEAWVINYTNPMTLCVRTLYEIFPAIKAFGCCHEVFGTQHLLARMLKEMRGIEDINRDDIKVNVLGINHFTWLDQASFKGINLFPLYEKFSDKYYESGYGEHRAEDYFSFTHRIKFDLFKKYGLIAAAGDRHLAEFMPGNWYLKDPDTVHSWGFSLTPVEWRINDKQERLDRAQKLVAGEEEIELKESGEEGVDQIKAILGLKEKITNVNLPNTGQMPDLPAGVVVETNARFSADSVSPVNAGRLPRDVRCLVERQVLNQEAILEAVLKNDRRLAINTFAGDPLVTVNYSDAEKLFTEMVAPTTDYLPDYIQEWV